MVAHRVIALTEFMPIVGGAVAIVERVVYALFGSDSAPWRSGKISSKEALEKRRKLSPERKKKSRNRQRKLKIKIDNSSPMREESSYRMLGKSIYI